MIAVAVAKPEPQVKSTIATFAALSVLGGCASYAPVDIAKPSEITVENALNDIANGLVSMKKNLVASDYNFGLLADEIDIELKLGVSAKDGSKLALDVGRTLPSVTASLKGEMSKDSSADKSNTIKIKLKNVLTAPLNDSAKAAIQKDGLAGVIGTGTITTQGGNVKK